MGSDVHYIFQKKTQDSKGNESWETLDLDQEFRKNEVSGEWEDGEYYIGRHYLLFAVIAGVRNGYGFAGVYRHEPLIPIAEGRGFPKGITSDWLDNEPTTVYGIPINEDVEKLECLDLGDHSFNWLLGSEILDWFKTVRYIEQVGVVDKDEYFRWVDKGYGQPDSYSTSVSGGNVVLFDELGVNHLPFRMVHMFRQYANVNYIKIKWTQSINESLSYFKDMIQKLVDEHGEIRMVMGFDS